MPTIATNYLIVIKIEAFLPKNAKFTKKNSSIVNKILNFTTNTKFLAQKNQIIRQIARFLPKTTQKYPIPVTKT